MLRQPLGGVIQYLCTSGLINSGGHAARRQLPPIQGGQSHFHPQRRLLDCPSGGAPPTNSFPSPALRRPNQIGFLLHSRRTHDGWRPSPVYGLYIFPLPICLMPTRLSAFPAVGDPLFPPLSLSPRYLYVADEREGVWNLTGE